MSSTWGSSAPLQPLLGTSCKRPVPVSILPRGWAEGAGWGFSSQLSLFAAPFTPSSPSAPSGAGPSLPQELLLFQLALTQRPGSRNCAWGRLRSDEETPELRFGVGQEPAELPDPCPFQPGQRGAGFLCLITAAPGGGRKPRAKTEM